MKKKVILLVLLLAILATCFIPFTQQKTITVKSSFFNTYQQLAKAENWKKWRVDLRNESAADSNKISAEQDTNRFKLKGTNIELQVRVNGYSFEIYEDDSNKEFNYSYTVVPEKIPNATSIIVAEKTNVLKYLLEKVTKKSFSETHIDDFSHFMGNPDLYYGYKIIKRKVTDTNMVVLNKVVLSKDKFIEVAKTLVTLKQYLASKNIQQSQPLIAQFIKKANDSVLVNVGLPISKKIIPNKPIAFMGMPEHANLYTVRFHGKFKERTKAYNAVQRYFSDRNMFLPILPFETYLDNKLPKNDSDIVNIQINFATF
jgi:effector-binding domain-containing protein